MPTLPLFPTEASVWSTQVDLLFLFLVLVSVVVVTTIGGLILFFVLRYRRRSPDDVGAPIVGSTRLEIAWTIIPLGLFMIPFVWGAWIYMNEAQPPSGSEVVQVVAKQWMWKFQHATGQTEINELHVPVGVPVQLTMTSQDVIHSLFVPNFRIKQDVLPGRYTTAWFEATQTGQFHLFCSQYCGTNHTGMVGWFYAMTPSDYQAWLAGGSTASQSPAQQGANLFQQFGCSGCHHADGTGPGPSLVGVYGSTVKLADGTSVTADEAYIRESILNPGAKIVAGYQNIMPSFQGRVAEDQILQLIAYIRSLASSNAPGGQSQPQPQPAGTTTVVPAGTPTP